MRAFKIGDLVQVNKDFSSIWGGKIGTIKRVKHHVTVEFADDDYAHFQPVELQLVCTGCRGLGEGAPMDDGTVTKCPRCNGSKLEPDEEG